MQTVEQRALLERLQELFISSGFLLRSPDWVHFVNNIARLLLLVQFTLNSFKRSLNRLDGGAVIDTWQGFFFAVIFPTVPSREAVTPEDLLSALNVVGDVIVEKFYEWMRTKTVQSSVESTYCYSQCCSHLPVFQPCTSTCRWSERSRSRKIRSCSSGRGFSSCSCSRASQDNSNQPACLEGMSRKALLLVRTLWIFFHSRNEKSIKQRKGKLRLSCWIFCHDALQSQTDANIALESRI